jgi:hypothetical protein
MMPIEEIEAACDAGQTLDFSKGKLAWPELPLHETFYPLGFPMELWTNSIEALELTSKHWGMFEKQHDTEPVRVNVHVVEGGSAECPPPPKHRFIWPMLLSIADADNYMLFELDQNKTHIAATRRAMEHELFVESLFLAAAPGPHITVRHATPIHAGCVALNGHGVLLCGDSGAGKSTLSYACARAGWTYISDDASFLLNNETGRRVIGNCYQIRFRPTAADLFPELQGQKLTPRPIGKPSIEMPTALFSNMIRAQAAPVDFIVFLNRRSGGPSALVPYRTDVARYSMRQTLFGTPSTLAVGYKMIEQLLTTNVLELRYTDLDWAIDRLRRLVREGQ